MVEKLKARPLPVPSPSAVARKGPGVKSPALSFGMMPARVVDDRWVNMQQPGQLFIIEPRDYPLRVGAGLTVATELTSVAGWDHFVLYQVGWASRPANGIPFDGFAISVRMRDLATNDLQFDRDAFGPLGGVFGFADRPKKLAMPWVIPANSTILIEVQNNMDEDMDVWMQFHAMRKAAL